MKERVPNREEILRVLESHAPRAMHVGELCGRLDVPRRNKDEVLRQLLLLSEDNLVGEMPGLRFRALKGAKNKKRGRAKGKETSKRKARAAAELAVATTPAIEGRLTMTRQGYGFVNVYDGSPDVLIPPDAVGPALHGDTVQIRARPSPKGREGHVVGIAERRPKEITGAIHPRGRGMIFEPDDERLRSPMRVVGPVSKAAKRGALFMIGYHGDKGGGSRWLSPSCGVRSTTSRRYFLSSQRRALKARGTVLPHTCDTKKGSSGAPIFMETASGPKVIAINAGTTGYALYRRVRGSRRKRSVYTRSSNVSVLSHAFLHGLERFKTERLLNGLDEVKQLQTHLKASGLYKSAVDGIYGRGTRDAILTFEKQNDLAPLGLPTRELLRKVETVGTSGE